MIKLHTYVHIHIYTYENHVMFLVGAGEKMEGDEQRVIEG
jgi:hypothetical protein